MLQESHSTGWMWYEKLMRKNKITVHSEKRLLYLGSIKSQELQTWYICVSSNSTHCQTSNFSLFASEPFILLLSNLTHTLGRLCSIFYVESNISAPKRQEFCTYGNLKFLARHQIQYTGTSGHNEHIEEKSFHGFNPITKKLTTGSKLHETWQCVCKIPQIQKSQFDVDSSSGTWETPPYLGYY